MLGSTYGHGTIRDYVVSFGTLFNDISIIRKDSSNVAQKYVRVPLAYAPQERFLARLNQDPTISKGVAITLPRMSFEMTNMTYAAERKLGTTQRLIKQTNLSTSTGISSIFAPVPYDFGFSLFIYTRNTDDATNVVEQILPFFTPEFTLSIKSMTDLGIALDIPIILNGISKEDSYEGSFDDRRTLIWTLDFTLKGQLFGPVNIKSGLIKKAYIDFYTTPPVNRYAVLTGNVVSLNVAHGEMVSGANNQVRLANDASSIFGYYNGANLHITAGTSKWDEVRVTGYNGTTRVANVYPYFSIIPDNTTQYRMTYFIPNEHYDGTIQPGVANASVTTSRITLQPGLTSNGNPTTNSTFSIGIAHIDANDDYGIIKTITILERGTRRNIETGDDE